MEFVVADNWKRTYPGAVAGLLVVRGVANPTHHDDLERRKAEVESELRERFGAFDRPSLRRLAPLDAYDAYYRRFGNNYPVQHQLESVVHKGRAIPSVAALVEAMFIAELHTQLLTAGHDLDALRPPIRLAAAVGGEPFERLDGRVFALKPDDMYMADGEGIISSVLHGPDRRTALNPATTAAAFACYAPPGIGSDLVRRHFTEILALVRLFAPQAAAEVLLVEA